MAYPLPQNVPPYSWEEYLDLEAHSEERYEYHDGEIVAMSGGTNRHNKLTGNIYVPLKLAADRSGCETFMENVKLFRHQSPRYLYPDAMVTCAALDKRSHNGVRQPWLVVEVLSKGSAHRDVGFKMREYFRLPSLQHYLVVAQELCFVQHFQRQAAGGWAFAYYADLAQSIELPELKLSLPLAEVYQGIEFGPELSEAEEETAWYGAAELDE